MRGIFTILAVSLVFSLARRYMSAASVKPPVPLGSIGNLDSRFRNSQWIVGISMSAVGVLFAVSTHAALVWLNKYFSTNDGPAEFRLWQQSAIWWFFPGVGALAFSWEIVLQLWSDIGNRDVANLYNYWSIQKSGFNAPKLLRWMGILVALPIGVLTILALPMHVALRQDDIHDCGYAFASCKVYRYADARRITMIEGFRDREDKLTRRAGIVIDFNDGRRWSSADIGDFSSSVSPGFAEFLEKKTQLPLNNAQTEADIPRLNFQSQSEKR
jgi:hypothetical protein